MNFDVNRPLNILVNAFKFDLMFEFLFLVSNMAKKSIGILVNSLLTPPRLYEPNNLSVLQKT
jgi:hypothetical protein